MANLNATDLAAVPVGGQVNEDVMDAIYDISPEDRPFTDLTGSVDSDNQYKEWVREELATANANNARIDGSDSTGNDTRVGERLANYHQIMTKKVRVSDRARESDTIGTSDELDRQITKRQKELRRDEEAAFTSRNAAVAGDGSAVAGKLAGIGSWIGTGQGATNTSRGITTGADPILSGSPGGFPQTAPVSGVIRALALSGITDMMRVAYENGGNPTIGMSVPAVIDKLSKQLFASTGIARIETQIAQTNKVNSATGNGVNVAGVSAQGSVTTYNTSFGTLSLVSNRFQPIYGSDHADFYMLDMDLWERAYLQGYMTKDLARTGIAENREISLDVSLCSLNEEGNAVFADIDFSVDATD